MDARRAVRRRYGGNMISWELSGKKCYKARVKFVEKNCLIY